MSYRGGLGEWLASGRAGVVDLATEKVQKLIAEPPVGLPGGVAEELCRLIDAAAAGAGRGGVAGPAPHSRGLTVPVEFAYVQARGTYRELGRAVGEATREQVAAALAYYREHFPAMAGIEFAEAERRAQKYLDVRAALPAPVRRRAGRPRGGRRPAVLCRDGAELRRGVHLRDRRSARCAGRPAPGAGRPPLHCGGRL